MMAGQSKIYRYSTAHQVAIDTDARLVVAVGPPTDPARVKSIAAID